MECPARHLQDSPGQERNFLDMRARAMSRTALGGSGSPMMGERSVSRAALEAGGSVSPMMGERAVSRAAFTAGGSVSPCWGSAQLAAWPSWPAAAFLHDGGAHS